MSSVVILIKPRRSSRFRSSESPPSSTQMSLPFGLANRLFGTFAGTNVSQTIYNYQLCLLHNNSTGFGTGNADLGGVGVLHTHESSLLISPLTFEMVRFLHPYTFCAWPALWEASSLQYLATPSRPAKRATSHSTTVIHGFSALVTE
jgi:hypothetical protein